MEEHFFSCQCSDFNHVFRFCLLESDGEVHLEVHLNHYERWYKRIWIALKYIFKKPHAYGHYDVTILCPDEFHKLHDLLDRAKLIQDKKTADWALKMAQDKPASAE